MIRSPAAGVNADAPSSPFPIRPHIPERPVPPPSGYLAIGDRFVVPGIAEIHAAPHRSRREARAFAQRIAREPAAYLDVLTAFNVGGILDHRPSSHCRGGSPFGKAVNYGHA